jgi:hypothetical protein
MQLLGDQAPRKPKGEAKFLPEQLFAPPAVAHLGAATERRER